MSPRRDAMFEDPVRESRRSLELTRPQGLGTGDRWAWARWIRRMGVLCLAWCVIGGAWSEVRADEDPPRQPALGDHEVKDPAKVYFGNCRMFKKPAVIDADRVYRRIPEYKKILARGLTDRDPAYHLLMKKASQRFNEAVKQMARDMDHDLVVETGSLKKVRREAAAAPVRTDEVIRHIR